MNHQLENVETGFIDILLNSDGLDYITGSILSDTSLPERSPTLIELEIIPVVCLEIGEINHQRCKTLYNAGARFNIYGLKISGMDSDIYDRVRIIADKGRICQDNILVTILQVEIVENNDIKTYGKVTTNVIRLCYMAFRDNDILAEGSLLHVKMTLWVH